MDPTTASVLRQLRANTLVLNEWWASKGEPWSPSFRYSEQDREELKVLMDSFSKVAFRWRLLSPPD